MRGVKMSVYRVRRKDEEEEEEDSVAYIARTMGPGFCKRRAEVEVEVDEGLAGCVEAWASKS